MNTKRSKRRQADAQDSTEPQEEIASPSRITHLHVQDRETSKVAGAPRAWRKMTELERSYMQERFGARGSHNALKRFNAGVQYTELWDLSQKAGRDSTANFDAGRCMGNGLPLGEASASAVARLVRIEMRLGQNDRTIVRALCAWDHSIAEAMRLAKLGNDTRASARACEALDALAEAMDATAKNGRRA